MDLDWTGSFQLDPFHTLEANNVEFINFGVVKAK